MTGISLLCHAHEKDVGMKWLAAAFFALAVLVRLTWHSSITLGFPISPAMSVGFPISSILFWVLLLLGVSFTYVALLTRKR